MTLACANFSSGNDTQRLDLVNSSTFNNTTTLSCSLFDFALYTVCGGLLCVLGLVGNTLSFIVLLRDSSRSATAFLLRALAAADSLVLLAAVPLYVLPVVYPHTGRLRIFYDLYLHLLPVLWPVYLIPVTAAIFLTVLVSVDRFIAVCRPFRSARLFSPAKVRRLVGYVVLAAVVYNIPRFFEYESFEECTTSEDGDGTATRMVVDISALGQNIVYRAVYSNTLYFVVMHGGPLVTLACLNVKLIQALRIRQRKRTNMTSAATGGESYLVIRPDLHQSRPVESDAELGVGSLVSNPTQLHPQKTGPDPLIQIF